MTTSASVSARARLLRRTLLIGCAVAGLGTMAGRADAQAINGTPTTIFGGVVYNRATPGVETIQIDTGTAVIDWRPTTGTFLPAGNTATFVNGIDNGNFVVLNRVISTTPVRFDGSVLSRLIDFSAGTVTTGGTVIFSSPGGLIVGSTGVFDVGNLVLTTLNVDVDAAGNFYDPTTRGMSLTADPSGSSGAAVVTEAGAQLNALQPGSYVALIGQVVQHGGATRVNGSAAYVAGEQVTFRANQGLFDIIVDIGSDNAIPLIHTGSTGGPSNIAATDNHAIYMVAAPKNQAITALLQGDIGFDPAATVGVENGVIVLSAGANVLAGGVDRYGQLSGVPGPDLDASFELRGGTVRSDLFGYARTDIIARPSASSTLTFQQDVSLFGGRLAELSAGTGTSVDVLGDALVSAAAFNSFTGFGDLTGGTARILADGGTVHVAGLATVDASATGLVTLAGDGGAGTGGTAEVIADGGTITIDKQLDILATGTGGTGSLAPVQNGGAGTGGTATLSARGGGTINASDVSMIVDGTASDSGVSPTLDGAAGTGGTINVTGESAGSLVIDGTLFATANGRGGDVPDGGGPGGSGQGGAINIGATDGDIDINSDATLVAGGTGGQGPTGGAGQGGNLNIDATRGSIDFFGQVNGGVDGVGGDGNSFGQGGDGLGGTVSIATHSSDAPSRISGGILNLFANGFGGRGGGGAGSGSFGGDGGNGTGGSISVFADSANTLVQFGALMLSADGTGGEGGGVDAATGGGTGGGGFGGTAVAGTSGAGAPGGDGTATFASADIHANGIGGLGGFAQGAGGNGTGGTAGVSATGATATVTGATTLTAEGRGGLGGPGLSNNFGPTGNGTGGSVEITAAANPNNGGAGTLALAAVTGSANATGALTGNVAGAWHVGSSGGSNANMTSLTLTATAQGTGAGVPPASTLDPQDGTITVSGPAQLSTDGDIQVNASQAGRIAGGDYVLVAGRDVVMSDATPAAGAVTVDVANLSVQAARDVTFNTGVLTRSSNITDIQAGRLATFGGRAAGRDVTVTAPDLVVTATGGVGETTSESVDLEITNNAAIAGTILGQDILVNAATIGVGNGGQVGGTSSTRTELRATGAVTVDGSVLGDAVVVNGASLGVGATGAVGGTTTQTTTVQVSGNAIVGGQMLGRNILVNAAAINVTTSGTIGGGAATDLADLNAPVISVAGRARGRSIRLASADLDIGANGAVGDAATQLVTLAISTTGQPVTLGGTAQGTGYTLTNAEAGRIRADTLRVNVPTLGASPAVFVRDLTLNGGGAANGLGVLDIGTAGVVRVEGAVLMTGARTTDGISLFGQQRLEVVTPTASVRVRDANGAPGGVLNLSSNNIWIASSAIIDSLRADPNYAGRDDDLIDNDGVLAPRGYVEGGGVIVNANGTFYVQNTTAARGTFVTGSDFGGITTGAGGLTIIANGPDTNVYAFGRRVNADGSVVFGDTYFYNSTYNTSPGGSYTSTAALNTCIIVTGQCPVRVPPDTGVDGKQPITGPTDGSVAILLPQNEQDDVIDSSFASDPLIEEPVTSGSEPGQWNCDPDHDGDCDDQPQ